MSGLTPHVRSSRSASSLTHRRKEEESSPDAAAPTDPLLHGNLSVTIVAIERQGNKVVDSYFLKVFNARDAKRSTYKTQVSKTGQFLESTTLELDGTEQDVVRIELYAAGLIATMEATLELSVDAILGMVGANTETCSDFWLGLTDVKTQRNAVDARVAFEFRPRDKALRLKIIDTLTMATAGMGEPVYTHPHIHT
jgi:hypothetical protein